jgi:predicted MFS family arabinose efflux permease
MIPQLVPADRLEQANALEGVSFGLASLVGALLAGLAVSTVGPGPALVFDAVSYLAFAVLLGTVRPSGPPPRSAADREVGVLRLALSDPVLRGTTLMFALFNVGEGALLVFLPQRATDLGLETGGYGYLVAATTAGELLAAVWLTRRAGRP